MRLVDDPDFTLIVGDVRERLRELPDESVNCVVTSPPYFGLRDYQTGTWEGGDEGCDHKRAPTQAYESSTLGTASGGHAITPAARERFAEGARVPYRDACPCGARRLDRQLGLEPTPDEYLANMVEVFREVRRVLRHDGTCWVNIGDSYASQGGRDTSTRENRAYSERMNPQGEASATARVRENGRTAPDGLKPKDLCMIPARLALALQADGWWLRAEIVWAKPNPMPESVTDRPTRSHEMVYLLTRSARYWYDADAVAEGAAQSSAERAYLGKRPISGRHEEMQRRGMHGESDSLRVYDRPTRNLRSVWDIVTEPFAESHFATFPTKLVERCLKAGCPEQVCRTCGEARRRIVDRESSWADRRDNGATRGNVAFGGNVGAGTQRGVHGAGVSHDLDPKRRETLGFTDCGHDNFTAGVCLDPFLGSGTTALVARRLGRKCIGIELSPEYAALAARRLQQLSLFAGVA